MLSEVLKICEKRCLLNDVRTSIKQKIKDLVAQIFIQELPSKLEMQCKQLFFFHLILVGILSILIFSVKNKRGMGWFLLNGKNLLRIMKVTCRQSLSCVVPRLSTLLGQIPTRIYFKQKIKNKKYRNVLAFLAFIFRSSFEAMRSPTMLLKDSLTLS